MPQLVLMINQSVGGKMAKLCGFGDIHENHENLLPSKIPCLTVIE